MPKNGLNKIKHFSFNCFEHLDLTLERGAEKNVLQNLHCALSEMLRFRAQCHKCTNFLRHPPCQLYYILQSQSPQTKAITDNCLLNLEFRIPDKQPVMVVHTCNHSIWETGKAESQVGHQPSYIVRLCLKMKTNKQKKNPKQGLIVQLTQTMAESYP
jgi:hypothetical protein